MNIPLIRMEDIRKVYDNGIVANDNAFIEINEGEIHALAGENGAGKSTLMKILFGIEKPNSGKIYLSDEDVEISSPLVANQLGIGMVHQHFMLIDELSVAENIILGNEIVRRGIIDKKKSNQLVNRFAKELNMDINPEQMISDLSIVQKQKVEILKVLSKGPQIIILDEPTAVLTPQETKEFFEQLRLLRSEGHTIIIITHKLDEIKQICDRITIMRNGKFIGTYNVDEISQEEISKKMVGRDIVRNVVKEISNPENIVLAVSGLNKVGITGEKVIENISFDVYDKEIVCISGVEGNGQRELVNIITGNDKNYQGTVILNGENIHNKSIKEIRGLGGTYIPEDRNSFGVDVHTSITENLISTHLVDVSKYGFISNKKSLKLANDCIDDYQIKSQSPNQNVSMLSGGNIQKVVIARETMKVPKLLVADQPTRGVDIGAIEFIHQKIVELRDLGSAVLLISSDLSEVLSLADRILVFYKGNIVANIADVKNLTEDEIGLYMLGLKKMEGYR